MQSVENFVGETVSTYLYFYIDFVDGELADSLEEYLQEHVVNARDLDESVRVGLEDRINASDVTLLFLRLFILTPLSLIGLTSLVFSFLDIASGAGTRGTFLLPAISCALSSGVMCP